MQRLDRDLLRMRPLAERRNLLDIRKVAVLPGDPVPSVPQMEFDQIRRLARRILSARESGRPIILTYGAHLIKNGLGPLIAHMIRRGWVTHVATNGAGSIHDWEFSHIGQSSEDVRTNVARGQFGAWNETGLFTNLAVAVGCVDDLGYGWAIGRMIADDGINIPSKARLKDRIRTLSDGVPGDELGALSDAFAVISKLDLPEGRVAIDHPFKEFSVQFAAWKNKIPFTVHPGVGYDIIYIHPANSGGAIGRAAVKDFLSYGDSVSKLGGGVHIAVGSAVMAPMIFEKSLSMANSKSILETGEPITDYHLVVVDIQDGGGWDWSRGEPPKDNPAYYLRFCKSFCRMGGTLDYICVDNRAFVLNLCAMLAEDSIGR